MTGLCYNGPYENRVNCHSRLSAIIVKVSTFCQASDCSIVRNIFLLGCDVTAGGEWPSAFRSNVINVERQDLNKARRIKGNVDQEKLGSSGQLRINIQVDHTQLSVRRTKNN